MSLKLQVPVLHHRKLPPLFYASLGALLGLLVTAFVLSERASQKNFELLKEFGETVVSMAAQEVVESAVKEDLVSMHAVMQELVEQPRIKMATVHNLEQQLLVQAGQVENEIGYQVFSAPIALHDSVAGHVGIVVETVFPGDSALRWTLTGTAFLLVLMILLTLYETRGDAWYFSERVADEDDLEDSLHYHADPHADPEDVDPEAEVSKGEETADPGWQSRDVPIGEYMSLEDKDDVLLSSPRVRTSDQVDDFPQPLSSEQEAEDEAVDESSDARIDGRTQQEHDSSEAKEAADGVRTGVADSTPAPTTVASHYSDLVLALPNHQRLQAQLNRERFNEVVDVFESSLEDVLGLYGGELVGPPHNGNVYCIRFKSREGSSEGAFRAACSASLIDRLNQQCKIRFNILAEICHPDEDLKLPISQTGIFLHDRLIDDMLESRLVLKEAGDGRFQLCGLNAPFASLLDRQLEQLGSTEEV